MLDLRVILSYRGGFFACCGKKWYRDVSVFRKNATRILFCLVFNPSRRDVYGPPTAKYQIFVVVVLFVSFTRPRLDKRRMHQFKCQNNKICMHRKVPEPHRLVRICSTLLVLRRNQIVRKWLLLESRFTCNSQIKHFKERF